MGKNAHSNLPWAEIPILLAIARHQSFAAASEVLGIDRTTVARRLDRLEEQLDTHLFERDAGRLTLSAQGRRMLAVAERAEQALSHLQPVGEDRRRRYGKVRISVSEHVLSAFAPQFAALITERPEVFLELTTSNRLASLQRYEADIILRIGQQPAATLHTLDIGAVHFAAYRARSDQGPLHRFWSRAGNTELPDNIRAIAPDAQVIAAVDGVSSLRDMILNGGGAGVLPRFVGDCDTRLEAVTENWPGLEYRLYLGCLPEQRNLHRIRLTMKGLAKRLTAVLTSE
ncbi:LysR family transcriptional regulator [Litoreibacter albidus]|uniref:LysR family transcriptional regulator n=1 Tax=Litoreibacter albidus TaxID=670155 RepID=UPI0037351777